MRGPCILCVWVAWVIASAPAIGAPVYITGVPDWDQPIIAGPPPALNQGWNAWCVPTATANIMGYYRDQKGVAGIADGLAFPNKNAWPNLAPYPNNYQDDAADPGSSNPPAWGVVRGDIGWYMNTNDLGQTESVFPGNKYLGTKHVDIKPGLDGSAGGFTGYFPAHNVQATVTSAASNALLNTAIGGPFTVDTVWSRITTEIDAGRPELISFSYFALLNRQAVRGGGPTNMPDYDWAGWNPVNPQSDPSTGEGWTNAEIGHTVTLVGYWAGNDESNPFYNDDQGSGPNAIIVYDNRDGFLGAGGANPRGLPIVLPFDGTAPWVMNTEIQILPEPATLALVFGSVAALATWRKRRRA